MIRAHCIPAARLISLFLLLIVLGSGCTEKRESPVGIGLIGQDQQGEGPLEAVVYSARDTSFEEVLNTGASSTDYIGRSGNTMMRSLLRFEGLPQVDSILRATLKLTKSPGYSAGDFDISAYPLTTHWNELDVTWEASAKDSTGEQVPWESPGGDYDPTEAGRLTFDAGSGDALFEMDIDPLLVEGWISGESDNEGIILVSGDESADSSLAAFTSRQSGSGSGAPSLEIEYIPSDNPDTTVVDEFLVTNDVFIYEFQGDEEEITPALGDVPAFRYMLRFDLSDFDSTWTIIRADLDIPITESNNIHDDLGVETSAVLSEWNGPDTEIDNTILASSTVSRGDTLIELNLTGMVQLWVSGHFDNEGIILNMGRTSDLFGYLQLGGAAYPLLEGRPSLTVYYHKPGAPPFHALTRGDGGNGRTVR